MRHLALVLFAVTGCASTGRYSTLPSSERQAFHMCRASSFATECGERHSSYYRPDLVGVAIDTSCVRELEADFANQPGLRSRIDWLVGHGCPREMVMANIAPGVDPNAPASVAADAKDEFGNLQTKASFRGLKFGTKMSEIEGLECTATDDKRATCHRATDSTRIGGANIETPDYVFYKGRLARVILLAKGPENGSALGHAMRSTYGKGGQRDASVRSYYWPGYAVSLTYKVDPNTESGRVVFIGEDVCQQEEAEASAAASAKDDL